MNDGQSGDFQVSKRIIETSHGPTCGHAYDPHRGAASHPQIRSADPHRQHTSPPPGASLSGAVGDPTELAPEVR